MPETFDTTCNCDDCVRSRGRVHMPRSTRSTQLTPGVPLSPPPSDAQGYGTCNHCFELRSPSELRNLPRRNGLYCDRCTVVCTCGCGLRNLPGAMYCMPDMSYRCPNSRWECMLCYNNFPMQPNTAHPPYCPDCTARLFTCTECTTQFMRRSMTDTHTLCQECRVEHTAIRSYSYKPRPIFVKLPVEKNPVMYMGVELEIDRGNLHRHRKTNEDNAKEVLGARKEFYCKGDGSIDDGFEIVSHPASYAWWMAEPLAHFPKFAALGYKSYNTTTCGMHVHVNRDYFTTGEIFKLMEFFDTNPRFVLKISRRKPEQLRQWARADGSAQDNLLRARHGNDHDDRYHAVNLENEKTVEFRIFRGTLNIDAFKLNLAFVRTISAYVKDCSLKPTYPSHYCDWLKKHRGIVGNGKVATRLIEWVQGAVVPDEVVEV